MYNEIIYTVDGAAAIISFNRPDKLNALTRKTLLEMQNAIGEAEQDQNIVGIILTGEGRGFCSGMDLEVVNAATSDGIEDRPTERAPAGDPSMGSDFEDGLTFLMSVRKPVIAAVNGPCAGYGLSIALFCDLRFVADSVRFTTAFSKLGLVAEHGQSWILPRLIGPAKALDLFWSSKKLTAVEAMEIGMVDRVVPVEQVVSDAVTYIQELAQNNAPYSLMRMKRQVYRHLNMSLGDAMAETNELMVESLKRSDVAEGVSAFTEQRAPNFKPLKT
jgi:enoyl-CoA hydratase/carnithine racemase